MNAPTKRDDGVDVVAILDAMEDAVPGPGPSTSTTSSPWICPPSAINAR